MIEVTKAMCEAGWDALPVAAQESGHIDIDDMVAVLTAALALVERDEPRSPWERRWPSGRGALHPHYCVSCSDGESAGPGCINCRSTGMDQSPWTDCKQCRIPRRVKLP